MIQKKKSLATTKITAPKKKRPPKAEIELQQHKEDLELINKELAQSRMELEAALRQYSDLYDFAPVGYFTLGCEGTILQANLAGARLLGVEHDKLIKQNFGSFISPEFRAAFTVFFDKLLASQGKEICELRLLKNGNIPIWASIDASSFEGGLESRAVVVDVSVRKQVEEDLRKSEEKYQRLFETANMGIFQSTADGKVISVNAAFARMFNYDSPEDVFKSVKNVSTEIFVDPNRRAELIKLMTENPDLKTFENLYRRKDGTSFIGNLNTNLIRNSDGSLNHIEGIIEDINERKLAEDGLRRANEKLEDVNHALQTALIREQQLAQTDSLTNINNRRHLFELAEYEFEIAERYQQPLSVIMFDIDHFKEINDTFGHAVGDRVLQCVAQAACAELRSADVIGRYGGEEFLIVLPMTNAQQAYPLAERIRVGVAGMRVPTEKGNAAVTLSIGIVEIAHDTPLESAEDLIRNADKAMYAAKQAGRNRTEIGGQ